MEEGPNPARREPLVAWYVGDSDRGTVVFAATHRKARADGAAWLDLPYEEATETRRAPEYDRYLATGLPSRRTLVVEHGWHYECGGCFATLRARADGPDGGLLWVGDEPYCGPACRDREQQRLADTARENAGYERRIAQGLVHGTDPDVWAFVTRPRSP